MSEKVKKALETTAFASFFLCLIFASAEMAFVREGASEYIRGIAAGMSLLSFVVALSIALYLAAAWHFAEKKEAG